MRAVAIRRGQSREKPKVPSLTEMRTFRCDSCGEEFVIYHDSTFEDTKLTGSTRFLPKNTGGSKSIPTGLSCQTRRALFLSELRHNELIAAFATPNQLPLPQYRDSPCPGSSTFVFQSAENRIAAERGGSTR